MSESSIAVVQPDAPRFVFDEQGSDLLSRVMKARDVEEILGHVTHATQRLLGADICGIMLRDNDEIVMRRCIGNHAPETAALRMRPGQGVAGRVFETLEPCHVGDYLGARDAISTDFFPLARAEKVRSALATPVLSRGEIIGVLEVWRRGPNTFTAADSQCLGALATVTSVAIESARRYSALASTVTFQRELMRVLAEERSLSALAATTSEHARCGVLILDRRLGVEVSAAVATDELEANRAAIAAAVARSARAVDTVTTGLGDRTLLARAIVSGAHRLGWVGLVLDGAPDEGTERIVDQVAIAVALHHAEQRAGSIARAATLDALVWELLEGTEEARRAALSRAREMRVEVDRPMRLAFCAISDGQAERVREVCCEHEVDRGRLVVSSVRGDRLVLLLGGLDAAEADRFGQRLHAACAREVPGAKFAIGMSTVCPRAIDLPGAAREARIALDVASRRHPLRVAVHEQVGIVGLLLGLREDADLSRLVDSALGNLLGLAPALRDPLVETLRTFFETSCSQQATARCLGIHPKTVSYRLAKLTELTGLDLASHEDRLLADIALRLMELMGNAQPPAVNTTLR